MSALQLSVAAGSLSALGVVLVVWHLLPAQPQLRSALERLAPHRTLGAPASTTGPAPAPAGGQAGLVDRVGLWAGRHLPVLTSARVPTRELALLRVPVHRYHGEKAVYALIGLVFPPLMGALTALVGVHLPFVVPAVAGLATAVLLSFIPDYNARTDAAAAREEFARALGAYFELVALERVGGAGSTQALEKAAEVGDSWVFQRIREELARARWSGSAPWDALEQLAVELGLPELGDLADIMRLSGESGAGVYAQLRARAAGLRTALLSAEHARANAAGERMTIPVSLLALVFLALLATPSVLRLLTTT